MSVWNGRFDSKGNPCISLSVSGDSGSPLVLEAIIDTGFSGFLMMPVFQALPLGMPPVGTTIASLADGAKIPTMMVYGKVEFAGRSAMGPVILPNDNVLVLVGLGFLRRFELAMVISSQQIALLDEADMQKLATGSPSRLQNQGPISFED